MSTSEHQLWRLLLIDDDEEDYIITLDMLKQIQGHEARLDWAPTYDEGRKKIWEAPYNAVLVDYDLGKGTGLELIRQAVAAGYARPLILYTGRGSFELDMLALQAGATLYLTKSEVNPLLLERFIRYAIERKQVEEDLKELEKRYRELVQSAPAGIFEIDFRTQRFVTVNDGMVHLTGYSREELIAMSPFDILDDEGKRLFRERIKRWLAGDKPEESVEYKVKAKDGHIIYTVLNTTFITDDNGNLLGATVVGQDITQLKLAEQAAQEYALKLEQSNLELEEILSLASRNLYQPLKKVNRLFDSVAQKATPYLGETEREEVTRIRSYLAQMHEMINDLLARSKKGEP